LVLVLFFQPASFAAELNGLVNWPNEVVAKSGMIHTAAQPT
jgi:hypothetical protein